MGPPAARGADILVPAGTVLPLHIHTNSNRVVSISGVITLTFEGMPGKDLGPGSYAPIPGGMKHSAMCKPEAECKYLEVYDAMGDIKFVDEKK
jgi:quercetin dioxygenase-like cupin family protein